MPKKGPEAKTIVAKGFKNIAGGFLTRPPAFGMGF
jgi:hypothetical protein